MHRAISFEQKTHERGVMFFQLDRDCIPDCDALFSIYRISRVNELNDAFRERVMETQNWRAELKVVVADARRELIPWDASARAFQSGSGAHLRICLGKLDSRLTCSLIASPLSADSSLPLFLPLAILIPRTPHPSRFPSAYQRLVEKYPVCS